MGVSITGMCTQSLLVLISPFYNNSFDLILNILPYQFFQPWEGFVVPALGDFGDWGTWGLGGLGPFFGLIRHVDEFADYFVHFII